MAGSQDIARQDFASMGGEKGVGGVGAHADEELRDLESDADADAESTNSKAGSVWTILGSVSVARLPGVQ